MKELRVNQTGLAKRMKVSRPYITKVLHEDVNFSFRTAAKLANALKMYFFYNRHGIAPKRLLDSLIFPDVIVHKRGDDSNNLCVIEFKKSFTVSGKRRLPKTISGDIEKLQNMTIPKESGGEFGYQWGVHIIFQVESGNDTFTGVKMKWFHKGVGNINGYQKFNLPLIP